MASYYAFCPCPLNTSTPRLRGKALRCAPKRPAVVASQAAGSDLFDTYIPNTPIPRRNVLSLTAALAGFALLPEHAQALSKKRILAKAGPVVDLSSGVTYRDITVGKGYTPREGDTVAIHYSLFYKDLEVESSRESQGLAASPLGFTYGARAGPGSVMRGINVGMQGMKVGGLRLITVPPELGYGEKGKLPLIPENATIEFAVSLLSCKRQGTNPISTIDPKAQIY